MPKAPAGAAPSNQWLSAEPGPEPEPGLPPEPAPMLPVPPPVRAARQAWADHAVAQGAGPAEVDEMTKAQLVARYGAAPAAREGAG